MKGKFIEIIGIDGCGKTTICNLIQDSGYDAVFTAEPYCRGLAEEYKNLRDEYGVCYSFAVDRHHHMKDVIIPELEKGRTVICDRGLHCNLAYQAYNGASMEWTLKIQSPIMVMPDLIIWLLGNPVACAQRSGETDIYRLAEIQKMYSKAICFTPSIPVFKINIEHKCPELTASSIKSRIEELKNEVL
jgi:dTMP kinase